MFQNLSYITVVWCFGVCLGEDEVKRKGQVLTLLAEQALRCQDFKASYIHCQDLMATGKPAQLDSKSLFTLYFVLIQEMLCGFSGIRLLYSLKSWSLIVLKVRSSEIR